MKLKIWFVLEKIQKLKHYSLKESFKKKKIKKKALDYWSYAASNGQIDAQLKIADLNAHGNYEIATRDSYLAAVWSRVVAERTSILGKHQYYALSAYKNKNW